MMKVQNTSIPGLLIIEPEVFHDDRGFFFESYNERRFRELCGISPSFVQDNHSRSRRNVLRGLHYQVGRPQGKLVRVVEGEVFDVAVDLRRSSPTFGHWVGVTLSATNKRQLWIPEGFAHGFLVTSDVAEYVYKATDYWAPELERRIRWDDPALEIEWPLEGPPLLAGKDAAAGLMEEAETFS